ncbi:MAG: MOSC domain-containing protein [Paracoccaceae bacterium]
MTGRVAHIWRHPIKSHGREALEQVVLSMGKTMPWDRTWAVAHENAKTDGKSWAACANFSRVAKAPALQAITSVLDEDSELVTLSHPDRPDLRFSPDQNTDDFLAWVAPLMPDDRASSAKILRAPGRGMTDSNFPSISLNSLSSHAALEQEMDTPLALERWRGNIWIDGLEPWEEFNWIGKTVRIGSTELIVKERIRRCLATTANPATGRRDADTLDGLKNGWGHTDFGVYALVTKTGSLKIDDNVEELP